MQDIADPWTSAASNKSVETTVTSQMGPWGAVPAWILDVVDERGHRLAGADLRVYIALRSFADRQGHARPFVETLAERAKVGPRTVEKSIAKLRRLGLLTTRRRYRDDGSIFRCDYQLRDTPPGHMTGTPPGEMAGTLPVNSPGPSRSYGRSKNTPDEHTKGTHQRSDQNSTASSRFAPSGGGQSNGSIYVGRTGADRLDAIEFQEITEEGDPLPAKVFNDIRARDRDLFRELVGDQLKSDGSKFTEGTFRWDQFYVAFCRWKRKRPIRWPGRMLERIADDTPSGGVEDWLTYLGLESV